MKDSRIGVYFDPDPDLHLTVNRIAEIFSKMVHYFSPYIYEGWESVIPDFEEREKVAKEQEIWDLDDSQVKEEIIALNFDPTVERLLLQEIDNERTFLYRQEQIGELLI